MSTSVSAPVETQGAGGDPETRIPTRPGSSWVARWRHWLLLAPTLAVLTLLMLWPMVRVLVLSFQDFGLRELVRGEAEFIGFDNFVDVLTNERLWFVALPNTVGFAAVCVVLTVVVGTAVALLLHELTGWTRGIVLTAIMAAWAVPAVTGTYVWIYLFDARSGFLTGLLDNLGVIDTQTTNLFDERGWFYAIAALNVVHHGFPFVAVTVLAGLLAVPAELHEAAAVDGATAWKRFWKITVPMLKPVFAVVTILSTIWDFKVFTQIYLMPGGDGSNRDVLNLGTWSYVTAVGQNKYGLGAAIAVLLTLVLMVITAIYLRTLFKEAEK